MALGFNVRVYGEVFGPDPYIGADPFSNANAYSQAMVNNFPTSLPIFHPLSQGVQLAGGGAYMYSVIEIPPTGLNKHSRKYAVMQTVAQLDTLRG